MRLVPLLRSLDPTNRLRVRDFLYRYDSLLIHAVTEQTKSTILRTSKHHHGLFRRVVRARNLIMGLFSTLSNTSNGVSMTDSSSKSSLDLPTVVQLYDRAPLLLEPQATPLPAYAMLSYSAIPLSSDDAKALLSQKKKQLQQDPVPELGVWNVCIQSDRFNLLKDLLATTCNTFAVTIDLAAPEQVETTMTMLQNALIRYLKERTVGNDGSGSIPLETATTSLFDLQSAHFGLAPQDSLTTTIEPDAKDRDCKICLVILAKTVSLAGSSEETQYRDQQVQALLKYHLYKFACQLKCNLIFFGDEVDGPDKEMMAPNITAREVAARLKDLAQGVPLSKPLAVTTEGSEVQAESSVDKQELSMFAPDNVDFVDSILLRNASFPGQWDAATTSVWKILTPPPASSAKASGKAGMSIGDQGWLKELRDSIVAVATDKTPVKVTKKEVEGTPVNDKNVASYFESLLGGSS